MKTLILILAMAAVSVAQVKLPPFSKSTLPNGATLILLERPELPLTSVAVLVKGGTEADPTGQSGLAALTADLMTRGTATRTSDQISTALDSMGANIRTNPTDQNLLFAIESLDQDSGKAIELLADIIRNPSFPEAEVTKRLAQAIDAVKAQKDNPQASIQQYYRSFFFGANHPYARPPRGDEASLAKLNREALAGFHKQMVVGRNLVIIAGGKFDAATMKARLEKAFGDLPAGTAYTWVKEPALKRAAEPRLLLVDKPDATQTYFYIGQPGIKRGHSDEAAIALVNTLFGGRFTSMLNEELRINTGLSYGANCRVDLNRLTGSITITSFTKTETTERAIDLALSLLKKLTTQGLNDAQLKSAKAYTKGLFPTDKLETTEQVMTILGDIETFGLNRGEIDDYFSRLDAVNLERANAVAKQYYQSDGLVFVLLGNASKIRDAVKKYAPGRVTEIPVSAPGFGSF